MSVLVLTFCRADDRGYLLNQPKPTRLEKTGGYLDKSKCAVQIENQQVVLKPKETVVSFLPLANLPDLKKCLKAQL